MKILLRKWINLNKRPHTYVTLDTDRFWLRCVRGKLLDHGKKFYIRVSYGRKLDVYGQMTEFSNEGEYSSVPELLKALKDFLEEGK